MLEYVVVVIFDIVCIVYIHPTTSYMVVEVCIYYLHLVLFAIPLLVIRYIRWISRFNKRAISFRMANILRAYFISIVCSVACPL